MIEVRNYSVDAGGATLLSKNFANGVFRAYCLVIVRKTKSVLTLPQAQIPDGATMKQAAEYMLATQLGLSRPEGLLQLHGRFVPKHNRPSLYLLRYLPSMSELTSLSAQEEPDRISGLDLPSCASLIPKDLLRFMLTMKQNEELGHNERGDLCVWTKAAQQRALSQQAKEDAKRRVLMAA